MLHAVWAGPGESNSVEEIAAGEGDCELSNSEGSRPENTGAATGFGIPFWLEAITSGDK